MTATGTLTVDGQTIDPQIVDDTELIILKRLNGHSTFSFSLLDREGALYGTDIGGGTNWEDAQGKTVTFQHSDGTYNFVGRIDSLRFIGNGLHVGCSGASIWGRDRVLSSEEGNFITKSGFVAGDPDDYQGIVCDDGDGNSFEWTPNDSLYLEKDRGVVIQPNNSLNSKTWVASAVSPTGCSATSGAVADTQADDISYYSVQDDSDPQDGLVEFTFTDTGNKIDSAADIKRIYVTIKIKQSSSHFGGEGWVYFQAYDYNGGEYLNFGSTYNKYSEKSTWVNEIIDIEGNLTYYLTDSGAAGGDYDQFKFRFNIDGFLGTTNDPSDLAINYIAVTIEYEDFPYSPVMAKLYGNDESTLYLTDGVYLGTTGFHEDGTGVSFYKGHADCHYYDADNEEKSKSGLNQTSEVLSFWMLIEATACDFTVWFDDTGNNEICSLHNNGGNFEFQTGAGNTNCGAIVADQWYRCLISYNKTDNECGFYLDGVEKVSAEVGKTNNNVDDIHMEKTGADGNKLYLDAAILGVYDTELSSSDNEEPTGGIACYTAGVRDNDEFLVGYSTQDVLSSVFAKTPKVAVDVDQSFDKYFPRQCLGKTLVEVLESVCELENASWYEEYDSSGNCVIGVRKNDDFDDSNYKTNSHAITTANYEWDFQIERDYNHYKGVRLFGNPGYGIDEYVEDTSSTSERVFTIVDESISTAGEAYEVAYEKLQSLKDVRPSIKLNIYDAYIQQLDVGKDVEFTCARPTLTGTYPIRKIAYHYGFPLGKVWAEVWLGLGQSPPDEKLANNIEKGIKLARKIQTDKLNPSNVIGTPAFSHTSLSNVTATQHHDPADYFEGNPTEDESGKAPTSEWAFDHAADDDAHHPPYTDADADGQIAAASIGDLSDVDLTDIAADKILQYNNVTSKWECEDAPETEIPDYVTAGALPYGEVNKAYCPAIFHIEGNTSHKVWSGGGYISNVDGTDLSVFYQFPKENNPRNHKLMIDAIKIIVEDADAAAYIDRTRVFTRSSAGFSGHFDEGTNITAAGTTTWEFDSDGGSPGDLDAFTIGPVYVRLDCVVDAIGELKITGVFLRYWYEEAD